MNLLYPTSIDFSESNMNKLRFEHLIAGGLFSLLLLFATGCPEKSDLSTEISLPKAGPTPTPRPNSPPIIESVTLSPEEIVLPCPDRNIQNSCSKGPDSVEVTTIASDPDGDTLYNIKECYIYEPSRGRVVGQGSKVIWDLSGLGPGEYTLKVKVSDGLLESELVEKKIVVRPCPRCVQPCTVNVSIPVCPAYNTLRAGRDVTLQAHVSGNSEGVFWTVTNGRIKRGDGTAKITIDTRGQAGKTVTARAQTADSSPICGIAACSFKLKNR